MRKEISSVCVGVLGDFRDLDNLIGPHQDLFDGVEMIGIGGVGRIRTLLAQAENLGYKVLTIHGRTMGPEYARTVIETLETWAYATAIIATPDLVDVFSLTHDILVHAPIFRGPENYRVIGAKAATMGTIWIENHHPGMEGLNEMFTVVVKLRTDFGIPAKAKIDLAHFIYPRVKGKDFFPAWGEAMKLFAARGFIDSQRDSAGCNLPIGIHLELGQAKDSLPIEDGLSDDMLAEALTLMTEREVEALTIELQAGLGLELFKPMGRDLLRSQRRNGAIFDRLQKVGIL